MRVLLLSQFFPPVIGGEERHLITLSEALAARGHEVSVATLSHRDRPDELEQNGVKVRGIRGAIHRSAGLFSDSERQHAPPFPDPELTLRLRKIIAMTKPDVVHAHNWLLHSFLPLKRSSKAGFVVTLHDYSLVCAKKNLMRHGAVCEGPGARCLPCASAHFGPVVGPVTAVGNWASSLYERRVVDRFIAVSRAVATQSGLDRGSVPFDVLPTFIPDAVGDIVPSHDERLSRLPKDGYLLFVGDLTRGKGADVLLNAYRQLKDPPPLVMIGRRCPDTPPELPDNVTVFESWPHALVMHAWSRCLFGIAPSVWAEACGTIVMEANAVGRPMIASRTGGLADLVIDGETGLLAPPGDADALAQKMKALIERPIYRERLAKAAHRHAETFKAKAILPQIERIYAEVAPRAARLVGVKAVEAALAG